MVAQDSLHPTLQQMFENAAHLYGRKPGDLICIRQSPSTTVCCAPDQSSVTTLLRLFFQMFHELIQTGLPLWPVGNSFISFLSSITLEPMFHELIQTFVFFYEFFHQFLSSVTLELIQMCLLKYDHLQTDPFYRLTPSAANGCLYGINLTKLVPFYKKNLQATNVNNVETLCRFSV